MVFYKEYLNDYLKANSYEKLNNFKDDRKGLKFVHRFTDPNTHPFDTVEWKVIDVKLFNWRDNSVNFEQKGVEFPTFWSLNAINIVTSKYFRGSLNSKSREFSCKQIINRVVNKYTDEGIKNGYFDSDESAKAFKYDLTYLLLNQHLSFNSPVWFNVGVEDRPQQVSACFILSVEDDIESIFKWYKNEGLIFKGGSGAGINLSNIRSSQEELSKGGIASGPVSFMRGADASAGAIKSGGATRRAAKMVILDIDHPDVVEFIRCKEIEEEKIKVLRSTGFDMDLGGRDVHSVQFQNANNSVRLTDEFMRAVENGDMFNLMSRSKKSVIESVEASKLFDVIVNAAWKCADPGLQFDDTINRYHVNKNSDRIYASNPCSEYMSLNDSSCNLASINLMKYYSDKDIFNIDKFINTVRLMIVAMDISVTFADFPTKEIGIITRSYRQLGLGYANLGTLLMSFGIPYDSHYGRELSASITSLMTGTAYLTSSELAKCIGKYLMYDVDKEPHLEVICMHSNADKRIDKNNKYTEHILKVTSDIWNKTYNNGKKYGYRNAQVTVLAPTGCLVSSTFIRSNKGLIPIGSAGLITGTKWQNIDLLVPNDIEINKANKFFLNGFADTKSIITRSGYSIRGTFNHKIKILNKDSYEWEWKSLSDIEVGDIAPISSNRISSDINVDDGYDYGLSNGIENITKIFDKYHIELVANIQLLILLTGSIYGTISDCKISNNDVDIRLTINDKNNLFSVQRILKNLNIVYTVDDKNLYIPHDDKYSKFIYEEIILKRYSFILNSDSVILYHDFIRGIFESTFNSDLEVFKISTRSNIEIFQNVCLLLGIALKVENNIGSDEIIDIYDIYPRYKHDLSILKRVIDPNSSEKIEYEDELLYIKESDRDRLISTIEDPLLIDSVMKGKITRSNYSKILSETDYKNVQLSNYIFEEIKSVQNFGNSMTVDISVEKTNSYIANGFISHNTIGFMMDCDTTGIEPDFSLVKYKKLSDGGSMKIINSSLKLALTNLNYKEDEINKIEKHIIDQGTVTNAPLLRKEDYPIFDCACSVEPERCIKPMGHVKMMEAVQPFLSGAISKTVNMPENSTLEDVREIYMQAWKRGIKAIAIYRDNCKVSQPLSAKDLTGSSTVDNQLHRVKLSTVRYGSTREFKLNGIKGYLTVNIDENKAMREIFLKIAKQGSILSGLMDAFSIAISIGLQYGIPLNEYVDKFIGMKFDPSGVTNDQDIRFATSIIDYIFRRLKMDFIEDEEEKDVDSKNNISSSNNVSTLSNNPCIKCGSFMIATGSCYCCPTCGESSGCS